MHTTHFSPGKQSRGFSLIEVVLAIGIFLVTILALVGLLGPTLKSVDEVERTDEVASVVNTLNAFLQRSPDIAEATSGTTRSKFEAIYSAVANDGYATVFVFRAFRDATSTDTELKVGFWNEDVGTDALIDESDFQLGGAYLAAGAIYRVVLSPSSVLPEAQRTETGGFPAYRLVAPNADAYPEGYFAMEARIYAEDPGASFDPALGLESLQNLEPIFTYNTAIVR